MAVVDHFEVEIDRNYRCANKCAERADGYDEGDFDGNWDTSYYQRVALQAE